MARFAIDDRFEGAKIINITDKEIIMEIDVFHTDKDGSQFKKVIPRLTIPIDGIFDELTAEPGNTSPLTIYAHAKKWSGYNEYTAKLIYKECYGFVSMVKSPDPIEVTMEEIEEKFGRPVKIVKTSTDD